MDSEEKRIDADRNNAEPKTALECNVGSCAHEKPSAENYVNSVAGQSGTAAVTKTSSKVDIVDNLLSDEKRREETVLSCLIESFIPLTLAGFGQICTGLYLDHLSESRFFDQIGGAIALVTPLLNLKGNLEMNFSSRLATYYHTGETKTVWQMAKLGTASHGLSQCQTVSASIMLVVVCILLDNHMNVEGMMILSSSTILTASLASLSIESILFGVVIAARWLGINPDNIGTPIAASVGDVLTLFFYGTVGYVYVHTCANGYCALTFVTIIASVGLMPLYVRLARSHPSTRKALVAGWLTLAFSALISSGGGLILRKAHTEFGAFALLQPIIVGLIGNMCGIQASRVGTALHVRHARGHLKFGVFPDGGVWEALSIKRALADGTLASKVALMMIAVAVPTQLIFATLALLIGGRANAITWQFFAAYALCCLILITLFMYLCRLAVHVLWRLSHDPDYSVIPLLTSCCDFVGSVALYLMFFCVNQESRKERRAETDAFFEGYFK